METGREGRGNNDDKRGGKGLWNEEVSDKRKGKEGKKRKEKKP